MTKKLRDRETKTEKFINAKVELENRNRQFQTFIAAVSDEKTKKELILRQQNGEDAALDGLCSKEFAGRLNKI